MTPHQLRFASSVSSQVAASRAHIVVTGAGGWFGRATLEMLECALGPEFDSRVTAYGRADGNCVLRSGRSVMMRSLRDLAEFAKPHGGVCIAHYAFLTREKVGVVGMSDYVTTNRTLTSFVETQAVRLGAVGVFSTSSGAVYRKDGSLDDSLEANPYGKLKLEEEAAVARLRDNLGSRTAICRVFNVSGPYLNKEYALSDLILAALFQPELRVRAPHKVYRSYAHVKDIVTIGFAVMFGATPTPDAAYDTAGAEVVEVGELAHRVRSCLDCGSKAIVREENFSLPEDRYVGDFETFHRLSTAAGLPLVGLDEQILETASYLSARATAAESD